MMSEHSDHLTSLPIGFAPGCGDNDNGDNHVDDYDSINDDKNDNICIDNDNDDNTILISTTAPTIVVGVIVTITVRSEWEREHQW